MLRKCFYLNCLRSPSNENVTRVGSFSHAKVHATLALSIFPGIGVAVTLPSQINRQPYHPPGPSNTFSSVSWLRLCLHFHKYVCATRFSQTNINYSSHFNQPSPYHSLYRPTPSHASHKYQILLPIHCFSGPGIPHLSFSCFGSTDLLLLQNVLFFGLFVVACSIFQRSIGRAGQAGGCHSSYSIRLSRSCAD
jgi:hypothetical protein